MENLLIRDKEIERNRIKVVKALRDPSNKQCFRVYHLKDRNCFIGLIHKTLIGEVTTASYRSGFSKLLKMIDITHSEMWYHVDENDGGVSFKLIAESLINKHNFPNVPLTDSEVEKS